jgi:chromosome segregation ATPase
MATTDLLADLQQRAQKKLDCVEVARQDAQAEVDDLTQLSISIAQDVKAAEDKGFDEGVAQSGQVGQSDKIYSQAEMDAEIVRQTQPLQDQIALDKSQLDGLQGQVDSLNSKVMDLQSQFDSLGGELASAQASLQEALAKDSQDLSDLQGALDAKASLEQQLVDLQKKFDDLGAKEGPEAQTIANLQGSLDLLKDVVAKLSAALQPAPTPDQP